MIHEMLDIIQLFPQRIATAKEFTYTCTGEFVFWVSSNS